MNEIRSVGIPSPRVEGQEKVGGGAVYAVDIALADMLWAKVLRSPIAHGRITRIDPSKALGLPGVKAVLTGADLAGSRIGKKIVDMPLFADDVVRYVGERVAVVAAESEEIAAAALDLIEVEYADLPIVTDPLEAMAPNAPLLHPNVADYKGLLHKIDTPSNVFVRLNWKKGDVEEGFRQSDVVVENTFTVPAVHQAYIEPHCSIVRINADGTAEIWSSNKSPFALRDQVGNALQIAPANLIIHPCYVGGDFGGKGDGNDVALCYALAQQERAAGEDADRLYRGTHGRQSAPRRGHQDQNRSEEKRHLDRRSISSLFSTAAPTAPTGRRVIWSARTMHRARIGCRTVWSKKNTSTRIKCPAVICARRATCRLCSLAKARRIWSPGAWVSIRPIFAA